MKTNSSRLRAAEALSKRSRNAKSDLLKELSDVIEGPRRNRALVDINRISKFSKEGSMVIVPGKVLGNGEISHKVTVAALSFSSNAKSKIALSGGHCINLTELDDKKDLKGAVLLG